MVISFFRCTKFGHSSTVQCWRLGRFCCKRATWLSWWHFTIYDIGDIWQRCIKESMMWDKAGREKLFSLFQNTSILGSSLKWNNRKFQGSQTEVHIHTAHIQTDRQIKQRDRLGPWYLKDHLSLYKPAQSLGTAGEWLHIMMGEGFFCHRAPTLECRLLGGLIGTNICFISMPSEDVPHFIA